MPDREWQPGDGAVSRPTQKEMDKARMRVEWAARHVPNGPAYGMMRAGSTDASKNDIVMAVALITRRLGQERDHG